VAPHGSVERETVARRPRREAVVTRIQVDAPAPDFALADFEGREFRLSELRGRQNVLLVFNRGFT
jgi:hypothetical protein